MRKHILQTSLQLFSALQSERLSMEEIARRCSITKPTLYSYFRNRQAILFALFDEVYGRLLLRLQEISLEYGGDKRGWSYFELLFNEITSFFKAYGGVILIIIRETHKGGSEAEVNEHFSYWLNKRQETIDLFEQIITPLIRQDVQERFGAKLAVKATYQVMSGVLSSIVSDFFFSERVDVDQYRLLFKELFQNGFFYKEE